VRDIKKVVGKNIRKIRLNRHLTQEELAEKLDLHPSYIGLIERGLRSPSLETISAIAEFFKISEASLLYDEKRCEEVDIKREELLCVLKGRSSEKIDMLIKIASCIFG
jgi:transcriptional regulator with XRE-family HTH domain